MIIEQRPAMVTPELVSLAQESLVEHNIATNKHQNRMSDTAMADSAAPSQTPSTTVTANMAAQTSVPSK